MTVIIVKGTESSTTKAEYECFEPVTASIIQERKMILLQVVIV